MALTPEGAGAAREQEAGPGPGAPVQPEPAQREPPTPAGCACTRHRPLSAAGWRWLRCCSFLDATPSNALLQGGPVFDERFAGRAPWLLLGGGALLLLTVLGFVLSWYFTRYQVAEGYVRVNTGFLFKQQRQARLDRVQAIDVVQPLLARIFGLAELRFEVADAGESAVHLAYLRADEARQLRATILARASGASGRDAVAGAGAGAAGGRRRGGAGTDRADRAAVAPGWARCS